MSDRSAGLDDFAMALTDILAEVETGVNLVTPEAVEKGLKVGAREWRKGAPVRTGKYKRSIRHHMTKGGQTPTGEVGSPSLPGLPHLLEKGHATIGGGRVRAYPHIAPAAEAAFDETEKAVVEGVERVLS